MPQKQTIATIWEVTDDDTGMYFIGEVDGGFNAEFLKDHIRHHGNKNLLAHLAYMISQVMDATKEHMPKESACEAVSSGV